MGQRGGASRWRVCYQRGLPRLVLLFPEKILTGNLLAGKMLSGKILHRKILPGKLLLGKMLHRKIRPGIFLDTLAEKTLVGMILAQGIRIRDKRMEDEG